MREHDPDIEEMMRIPLNPTKFISEPYIVHGSPTVFSRLVDLAVFVRNFLVDGLFAMVPRARQPLAGKSSVLLVRLDSIGDFILWQDSLKELCTLYPPDQFRVTLLGNAIWTELADTIPFFDTVIPIDRRALHYDLRYRFSVWRRLRSTAWEEVIQPTHSREFLFGDAVVRVCGAQLRTGSQGDLANQSAFCKSISDHWYTRLISVGDCHQMELKRNAEFIRGLGRPNFSADLPELSLCVQLPELFTANEYAVFVPGAGSTQRQWPVERFDELARRIQSDFGLRIIICGSVKEKSLGRCLHEMLEGRAEDWTGRTSLVELASVIKGARLVIGNESGVIHIAAAVGVQAVCVMGGGHFGRFLPYQLERDSSLPLPVTLWHRMDCFRCGWYHCVTQVPDGSCAPCIDLVGVNEVWRAVRRLMPAGSF